MSDEEDVLVQCARVADLPVPFVDSDAGACDHCGVPIWLATEMKDELARLHPGQPVIHVCGPCGRGQRDSGAADLEITPRQIEQLLVFNEPEQVAAALALARIVSDPAQVPRVQEAIMADPEGPLAQEFRTALRWASATVSQYLRRN